MVTDLPIVLRGGNVLRSELARRAGIVVGATLAVVLTRYVLDPWLVDHLPYLLFVASVAASARWGGWPAGVAAIVVSATAGSYFFAAPRWAGRVTETDALTELAVFALVSSAIVGMLEYEIRLRRKIQLTCQQLRVAQERARAEHQQRLEAERERDEVRRLESIGLLAGGIAHDFNNLLTVVLGSADLLRTRMPEDRQVEAILSAGTQAADLVKQLLQFARREPLRLTQLTVNDSIRDGEKLLRRLLPADVELEFDLSDELWPLNGDGTQVQQLLHNLVADARDAMPEGGKVRIQTDNVTWNGGLIKEHPEVPPGEYVHLSISDTGIGLTDEVLQHIFEPFFSTKVRGQGRGLGLATVYGMMKQMRGYIYASSAPERGTVFHLYWPRATDDAACVSGLHPSEQSRPFRRLTVLLVDDDEAVLSVTAEMLRSLGHDVIAAVGPAAALQALRRTDKAIDALVTDVVMPRMNGRELADRVARERAGIPVIFMSGYSDDVVLSRGVLKPGTTLVRKPFSAIEIDQALRAMTADRENVAVHCAQQA